VSSSIAAPSGTITCLAAKLYYNNPFAQQDD